MFSSVCSCPCTVLGRFGGSWELSELGKLVELRNGKLLCVVRKGGKEGGVLDFAEACETRDEGLGKGVEKGTLMKGREGRRSGERNPYERKGGEVGRGWMEGRSSSGRGGEGIGRRRCERLLVLVCLLQHTAYPIFILF